MALDLAGLQDEIAVFLGTGKRTDDPIRTSFTRWINQVCRRIAYAYPWDEMRSDQKVVTIAPYVTGNVDVSNGSPNLTFHGSTLVAGMVGRKFALTQGGPYYRILSVNTGAGTAVLTENYIGATALASAFVIYQDEYDLATGTHAVEDVQVIDNQVWYPPLRLFEQRELDAVDYLGRTTGRPSGLGIVTPTTVGTPRVRFVPVPDAVYRVNVRYLRKWTALSASSDLYTTQGLPEDVESLIIDGALRWAPRVEGTRQVLSDDQWRHQLSIIWGAHKPNPYQGGSRRGIGRGAVPRLLVNFQGMAT